MIILVCGLPGSGKSYFAERLAKSINAGYLSSDKLRKSLTDIPEYSAEAKNKVYQEMLRIAHESVKKPQHLVIDATFHRISTRLPFLRIMENENKPVIIEVRADEALIRERVKNKRAYSDADFEVYKKIRDEWEPIAEDHLILESTNSNISEMLKTALNYIGTHDH